MIRKSWLNKQALILLVIVTFLSLASCLPDSLDVEGIPEVKPQIVVSTQFVPDRSLAVLLTKTFGALEPVNDSVPSALLTQIVVNDAVVSISGPNGADTLFNLGNGVYGGIFIPFQSGEEYTLNVTSAALGNVTATTTVKSIVSFNEIEADLYYNGFGDTLAQINYQIRDVLLDKNYYMLNVQEVERADVIENMINPRAYTRLLDDAGFAGQTYAESFRVVTRDYMPGDTIAVSLSNVSEEYYNFIKLRLDNRFSFVEFLGEPINYPSNVRGGKGFFNLHVPDFRFFVLQ
ncbi:DUF4249 domain-containing protein [Chryseosolibacter indicus]|uniref:DUF4249 family protein n=1 Tax=Chryseosolibacter indicus TaxID=2782351 RepID=A0ABS5VXB6_9BACT|nr:DUF4249 domain-containing protein [Chryseosolibacter indicus]MBT1706063.1 DUF4249 family protein [Chryseosolibacter indicus]